MKSCELIESDVLFIDEEIPVLLEEESKLLYLLEEWGFEFLFSDLKTHGITYERLKYLTENDLNEIFAKHNLGLKAEFRYHLVCWRKINGHSNPLSCDALAVNTYAKSWLKKISLRLDPVFLHIGRFLFLEKTISI